MNIEYSCLGFPEEWYNAKKEFLSNPHFDPHRLRIRISNYYIIAGEYEEYRFTEIPEHICEKMVKTKDRGDHYSPSSRYTYSIEGYEDHKGIRFGTASAVIKKVIIDNFDIHTRFSLKEISNDQH